MRCPTSTARASSTASAIRESEPTSSIARIGEARGVVVLPEEGEDHDISVTRTVLALNAELGGLRELPVVVEVADPITAQRLVHACGPTMYPIVTAEAITRTGAMALRQRGLSKVINELTDFHGCDLHVTDRPELLGVRVRPDRRSVRQCSTTRHRSTRRPFRSEPAC